MQVTSQVAERASSDCKWHCIYFSFFFLVFITCYCCKMLRDSNKTINKYIQKKKKCHLCLRVQVQVCSQTIGFSRTMDVNITYCKQCLIKQGLKQKISWAWTFFPGWGLVWFRGWTHTRSYSSNKKRKRILFEWFSMKLTKAQTNAIQNN